MNEIKTQSGKVLIVEDDRTLRRAASELFKALGYEPILAEDGASALKILQSQTHLDFLFSDVVLSKGLNGVELAEQARQLIPGIKVLLASGYPYDKIDIHGVVDEDSFISKPYRVNQLCEKMDRLKSQPAQY